MTVMILAVVYELDGDNDGDVARTELEILNDFPDALIARRGKIDRGQLRRKLGPPVYSAQAEKEEYRDVDVWKIQVWNEAAESSVATTN